MLAHPASTVVPAAPIDALDVIPMLGRIRRALDAALMVRRLPTIDEQRFSGVYVGLVDLERRLRQVARLCATQRAPGLLLSRADLLARATTAVELLESLTALFRLEGASGDALGQAMHHSRRILTLERAYGRALFA